MATKKAVTKTKKTVKTARKKAVRKAVKPAARKKQAVKKGTKYTCEVCGLAVSVDEVCGCVETCDIVCCGEQMKKKK
ncbi:MAG: hypothetical protein AB1442_09690 [Nitrospirota bacterium]